MDILSIEGLHTGDELSLPPWGDMVGKNDSGQWTELASSENSRNRTFIIAKNKGILPPWGTIMRECSDRRWKDVIPGNTPKCGFFLSCKMIVFTSLK